MATVDEFENLAHKDYKAYIRWLALKKKSYQHQIELLKADPHRAESNQGLIDDLKERIKEINVDYKDLDHRNF